MRKYAYNSLICKQHSSTTNTVLPSVYVHTHIHTHTHKHTGFLEACELNLSRQRTQALFTQFWATAGITRSDTSLSHGMDDRGTVVLLLAGAREFSSNGQHWITSKGYRSLSSLSKSGWELKLTTPFYSELRFRTTRAVNTTLPYGFIAWRFSKHMSQLYLFVTLCLP